jgi:amino acid permease
MKKKIILGLSMAVVAFALGLGYMTYTKTTTNALLLANLEALTNPEDGGGSSESGGPTIMTCLGIWGVCSTPSGAVSKAPYVEVQL